MTHLDGVYRLHHQQQHLTTMTKDIEFTQRWCRAMLDVSIENGMLPAHLREPTLLLMEFGCCTGFASGGPLEEVFRQERNKITDEEMTYEEMKELLTPIII